MVQLPFIALCVAATVGLSTASPCISFDTDFNLLAFGVDGKDYTAGKKESWASGNVIKDITTTARRPPFDGSNTSCYLAQYFNAIYFVNADKSHPSDIHIYDASKKSWSTQKSTPASGMDFSNFDSILDHDTNVFYALSKGQLFFADMGEKTAASSNAVKWDFMPAPDFDVSHYKPVMALAQNHVHFLNIGGDPGRAHIFVIHYAYWQPAVQSYKPKNGKGTFPQTYGTAFSLFQPDNVDQKEFAFFPQDGSGSYVVNILTNTTLVLPSPPSKGASALYAGCSTSLVQLDANKTLSYLPYVQGSTQYPTAWKTIGRI